MKGAILALLFTAALGVQLYGLQDPWSDQDIGYNGAFYSIHGRNFLRYGFLQNRLGPVENTGDPSLGGFSYYLNHPPLLSLCVGIAFRIFGIHEWAARLVPLVFSWGSLALLYLLGKRCWSQTTAWIATGIAASTPAFLFYGKHVEVYGSLLLFFTLLSFVSYEAWLRTGKSRFLALLVMGMTLAMASEWEGYLLPLFLSAHLLWRRKDFPPQARRGWMFPLVGLLCFFLFLGHAYLLFGRIFVGRYLGQLVHWQRLESMAAGASVSLPVPLEGFRWLADFLGSVVYGILPPGKSLLTRFCLYSCRILFYLFLYFNPFFLCFLFLSIVRRRQMLLAQKTGKGILPLLFGIGFFRILLFYHFSWRHRYVILMAIPFMAYLAALGIAPLWEAMRRSRFRRGFVLGFFLLFCTSSLMLTGALHRLGSTFSGHTLGLFVQRHTAFEEVVFTSAPRSYSALYYADRKLFFQVRSLERFSALRTLWQGKAKGLIIDGASPPEPTLEEALRAFPRVAVTSRYRLFRL